MRATLDMENDLIEDLWIERLVIAVNIVFLMGYRCLEFTVTRLFNEGNRTRSCKMPKISRRLLVNNAFNIYRVGLLDRPNI